MKTILIIIFICAAAGALVASSPPGIDGLDATNFALALRRYDLAAWQPHFPGYPIYIALARVACAAGASDVAALAWPGALGLVAGGVALAAGLRSRLGRAEASLAAAAVCLCPGVLVLGARPGSDALGLGLLLGAAGCIAARRPGAAGLLLGLLPGVRLSFALAGAALFAVEPSRRKAAGAGAGVLMWLVPFLGISGPGLVEVAPRFVEGHLLSWGGSAFDGEPLGGRALGAGVALLEALGGPGALVALCVGLYLGRRSLRPLALLVPYALYVFVVQDADDPRHMAPLVAALLGTAALGWAGRPTLAAAALACLVPISALRLTTLRDVPGPALAAARYLAARVPVEGTEYMGGGEVRVLAYHLPALRARRQPDVVALRRDLASPPRHPPRLLVSSGVAGVDSLAAARLVARFDGVRGVHREPDHVAIYAVDP